MLKDVGRCRKIEGESFVRCDGRSAKIVKGCVDLGESLLH